jgi:hypothetical protein
MEENNLAAYNAPLAVKDHLSVLLPRLVQGDLTMPVWPPDVFAISTSLLLRCGAYAAALDAWPPSGRQSTWSDETRESGIRWRSTWGQARFDGLDVPWQVLLNSLDLPLASVAGSTDLLHALVELSAVADEACLDIGFGQDEGEDDAMAPTPEDEFYGFADTVLSESAADASSLCREIHPSRMKVLPKMHTPQSGLTIRSFSLNLALIATDEIKPQWFTVPQLLGEEKLHILVVPWPFVVNPSDFKEVDRLPGEMKNMPDEFGFFEYQYSGTDDPVGYIEKLVERVEADGEKIDGIVVPELALSVPQYEALEQIVVDRQSKFLLAGVSTPAGQGSRCKNEVRFGLPNLDTLTQAKHHRWKLDASQINQYALNLDPAKSWWEHISLLSRRFMFVSLDRGLVASVLICEDLARPDPVGDLLRAVGPNLVIALLMDGPQLGVRWPGRYAASLANDPGSSVLSVTSIGMSMLSKPKTGSKNRNRVIGLWQSPGENLTELELPKGKEALILTITRSYRTEWSADGRSGKENRGFLHLSNWQSYPNN